MNATVFICGTPTGLSSITPSTIAFFPARAVGDEIGNYAIASAGTITNKSASDDTGNLNTATESVCPKSWTLPSLKQSLVITGPIGSDSSTYVANLNPTLGGFYDRGTLYDESTYGRWWSSTAYTGARRYFLGYNGSSLYTSNGGTRSHGFYVRCVSEEKTVTDLTYLQDMTGEIKGQYYYHKRGVGVEFWNRVW